jgi:hypothetical protein
MAEGLERDQAVFVRDRDGSGGEGTGRNRALEN